MRRWFAVIIVAVFCSTGCDVNHLPDQIADQQDKRQLCKLVIASHRSILESMFLK